MRVKFLRDELFENEGRNAGHTFKTGEVYDFDTAFADRWIRRGAAEAIGDDGNPAQAEARFTPVEVAETKAEPTSDEKSDGDDADLEKLRADYEELFGKKPHHASKAETLRNAINEELAK